jgi:hypothetical protein
MTVVELSIGMVVTAMVLGALGALWYAVAEAWRSTGASQAVASTANQVTLRLETTFRQTRYVISFEPGSLERGSPASPARAFIWRGDFWNRPAQKGSPADFKTPLVDGAIQIAELGLLEYDPGTARVYLYRVKDAAVLRDDQREAATEVPTFDRLRQTETRDAFRNLDFVERAVLADGVTAFKLGIPPTQPGSRPVAEFTLDVTRKGSTSRLYGTAALRSPSTQPAY